MNDFLEGTVIGVFSRGRKAISSQTMSNRDNDSKMICIVFTMLYKMML